MAADLDAGFLRQRRNLLMISIALLLFELANGDLTGVSLAARVTFDREWVVLLFGWIAFLYLWWRYLIRSMDLGQKIKHTWVLSVQNNQRYKKLATELQDETVRRQYSNNVRPLILRGWFSRRFDYSMNLEGSRFGNPHPACIKPTPYWRALAIEWRSILSVIFRHTAVSDYALPHLVALSTLVIGIWFNWDFFTTRAGDIVEVIRGWLHPDA